MEWLQLWLAGLEPWVLAAVGLVFLAAVAAIATIASELGGMARRWRRG